MKLRLCILLLAVLSLFPFTGCSCDKPAPVTVSGAGQPAVVMIVMDPELEQYAEAWKIEIARRFPNSVAVFVHGGEFISGVWNVETYPLMTAREVMQRAINKYPTRTPVLLSCNPGYLKLGLPGVYHATASVWCVPDRALKSVDDMKGRAKLALIPATMPTTGPATGPATKPATQPFGFVPFFDFSPGSIPFVFTRPSKNEVFVPRWVSDPDCVGNIFEFITD